MTKTTRHNSALAKAICIGSILCGFLGVAKVNAQNNSQAFLFYNFIQPQQNAAAAEMAAIRARPSNWLPGDIRDAVNYGAIAWYQKAPGQYGYVFNKGSIRGVSATMNVEMACEERKLVCEGMRTVQNEWLVIGSYNSRAHFAVATGPTRAAAEALIQEQCRKDGTTCTIKDAFEVMPHRRGAGYQRLQTVVR